MSRNAKHELLAVPNRDEEARQCYVLSLKRFLNGRLRSRNVALYEEVTAPARNRQGLSEPQNRPAMREALYEAPLYRIWSGANRTAQELMWLSIGEMTLREERRVRSAAKKFTQAPGAVRGSLSLDPSLTGESQQALGKVHVHLQPGGYLLNRDDNDLLAGALYESGGNLYSFGQGMGNRDSKAQCVIRHLEETLGLSKPARILELGCSAGAATCEYAAHYLRAEIHAVDIGAGLLRYAHARAEALGVAIHFHQMDAADLRFDDDSFDLVVSHNLLHEISEPVRAHVIREALRVLRPGGALILQDVPLRLAGKSLPAQAEATWDLDNNGELYWEAFADGDLVADIVAAGASAESVTERMLPKVDGPGAWYAIVVLA